MRSCNNCKFAVMKDFGYSNYTVEGTQFVCANNCHPNGEFDRFYGEDKRLEFGAECPQYEQGVPIEMDVDEEGLSSLTPEEKEIYSRS